MEDDKLILDQMESRPPETYSNSRFIIILVSTIFLVLLLAFQGYRSSRSDRHQVEWFEDSITGDIQVKAAYALKKLRTSMISPMPQLIIEEKELYRLAVKSYKKAIATSPNRECVRKLLIIEEPEKRKKIITLFDFRHGNIMGEESKTLPLEKEILMWRDIYIIPRANVQKIPQYEKMIRQMNLGWFEHLALAELYQNKGDEYYKDLANKERSEAEDEALSAMMAITLMCVIIALAAIAGIVFLIIYIRKVLHRRRGKESLPMDIIESLPENEKSFIAGYLIESFLAYLISMILAQIILGGIIGMVLMISRVDEKVAFITVSIISEILSGAMAMIYLYFRMKQRHLSLSTIGLNLGKIGRNIKWGIAGYASVLPLFYLAVLATSPINKRFPTPPNPITPILAESTDIISRLMIFILLAVLAPFFEELFFRGVLFNGLRAKWGVTVAAIASSALFASLHPLPISFIPIFILASVLAILTYECKSLIPNMLAHALHNSVLFVLMVLLTG